MGERQSHRRRGDALGSDDLCDGKYCPGSSDLPFCLLMSPDGEMTSNSPFPPSVYLAVGDSEGEGGIFHE